MHFQPFLHLGHLVALPPRELAQFGRILDRHHAHAVGAGVGLDDEERLLVDAAGGVGGADLGEELGGGVGEPVFPFLALEIQAGHDAVRRNEVPGIESDRLGEVGGDAGVDLGVVRFAPRVPARHQGRDHVLLAESAQNRWHAGREVVVEQDGAGVEVGEPQPVAAAHQGLDEHALALGRFELGGGSDFRQERADANFQPGQAQDALQAGDIQEIPAVARVVLGDE